MKFYVPITVSVLVDLEDLSDTDVGRQSADMIGGILSERIKQDLIPNPGSIRVVSAESGYPEHQPEVSN